MLLTAANEQIEERLVFPDESTFLWIWASAVEGQLNRVADNRFQILGQR